MSRRKKLVTFDLDSTLCDTEHRFKLIDRVGVTDWHGYAMACVDDELVEGVARLVNVARDAGYEIHYVTGRHEGARFPTITWLKEHLDEDDGVGARLHMDTTESGNHVVEFGSHSAFKAHMVTSLAERLGREVYFHIDDHPSVALELAKRGVPCIAVRPPYEVRELGKRDVTASNEILL